MIELENEFLGLWARGTRRYPLINENEWTHSLDGKTKYRRTQFTGFQARDVNENT